MEQGRVFVIGDIHGCLDALKRLVDRIQWEPARDELIFLGDFIDRGKDPKGVVDYILGLTKLGAGIRGVVGNHELMLLDFLAGRNERLFFVNGGTRTVQSYQGTARRWSQELVPEAHRRFYASLAPYIELPDCYIVHAGFKPGRALQEQTLEDLTWIREPFIYAEHGFGKKVIFGHTPFYEPYVNDDKIGIDTGAVYGGKLTCLELREQRFHSVSAAGP